MVSVGGTITLSTTCTTPLDADKLGVVTVTTPLILTELPTDTNSCLPSTVV